MADGFQVAPAGLGPTFDTKDVTARGHREVVVAGDPTDASGFGKVVNTDPAGTDYGVVVRQVGTTSPQKSTESTLALAAGSAFTLSSTQVGSGKTGKLLRATCGGSVPFKAVLKTSLNGAATTVEWHYSPGPGGQFVFVTPDKDSVAVTQDVTAGFDGFEIEVTNLDAARASDFHAAFYWDEV